MMTQEQRFDLVILGSGSTAFAAALRAQEMGKTSVMTEERTIGGTCVNRGCLPSKNLIEAAKLIMTRKTRAIHALHLLPSASTSRRSSRRKMKSFMVTARRNTRAWSAGSLV